MGINRLIFHPCLSLAHLSYELYGCVKYTFVSVSSSDSSREENSNPLSEYDDILINCGKNVHSQRFIYEAKDKNKGLIKIDSYNECTGCFNDKSYFALGCDKDENAPYAKDVLNSKIKKTSRYVIKDIRGSIEQLTCETGCKDKVFEYTAFGNENLNFEEALNKALETYREFKLWNLYKNGWTNRLKNTLNLYRNADYSKIY